MAIYKVETRSDGTFQVALFQSIGGEAYPAILHRCKDREELRTAVVELGKRAKSRRDFHKQARLAQVNPGEEKI